MDYLDPHQQQRHRTIMMVGYVLIAIALLLGVRILLEIAHGYGLGKNGQIIQNGFLFVSSQPGGAEIYLNDQLENNRTNSRLSVPSGTYRLRLERTGYRSWQRTVQVEGDAVERVGYPLLIPANLITSNIKTYDSAPGLVLQSPDRRWLLVERSDNLAMFDEYDLKNPKQAPTTVTIPANLLSAGSKQSLQLMQWSTDNRHIVLQHDFSGKREFIELDRTNPAQSVNLSTALGTTPTKIELINDKFDQYYLYNSKTDILQTATLSNPAPKTLLSHVLAYNAYGSNIVLYAASDSTVKNTVAIRLLQNGQTYNMRTFPAGSTYLLNITQYSGSWYAAIGASNESRVYIYKNPITQLGSKLGVLVPTQVLKAEHPTYLEFSANAQYIMDEGSTSFSVFDIFNDQSYTYDTKLALDTPQKHAVWMDSNRLAYVSHGKLVMFDFDHSNVQTLMPADAHYLPFFDPAYKFVDTLAPSTTAKSKQMLLTTTPLLTPADQ